EHLGGNAELVHEVQPYARVVRRGVNPVDAVAVALRERELLTEAVDDTAATSRPELHVVVNDPKSVAVDVHHPWHAVFEAPGCPRREQVVSLREVAVSVDNAHFVGQLHHGPSLHRSLVSRKIRSIDLDSHASVPTTAQSR